MKLLLDTNIVIWSMDDLSRLPTLARQMIETASEIFVSAVSIWEIGIKVSLGKLDMDMDDLLRSLAQAGSQQLPVTWEHGCVARQLPLHHRDPFDRMLVAQAQSEPLQLLTSDSELARYGSLVTVV